METGEKEAIKKAFLIQKYFKVEFSSKQHKLVRLAIEDAVVLFSGDFLDAEKTAQEFKHPVSDSGKPSPALRAYRNRFDITQRDLANKSEIPHIAAMESGKRLKTKIVFLTNADYFQSEVYASDKECSTDSKEYVFNGSLGTRTW